MRLSGKSLAFVSAAAIVLVAAGLWASIAVFGKGPLDQDTTVVVPRGAGLASIARQLDDSGVIDHPFLFMTAAKVTGADRDLKAGEFAFAAGTSMRSVIDLLRSGRTVVRRLTVPEGLTSAQVVALLEAEPSLSGDITQPPPEGSLLPETYHFALGDSRADLIARMQAAMTTALDELWSKKAETLPFETPEQALVLASIVEKETSIPEERARVAGVFVNRLDIGMRLQSDPTVVYAVTEGSGSLGRPLTRKDLQFESPFNTYVVAGLPPTPIANPGRAAIEAVLNPERHEYFYFVADGTGGHAFAKSLEDHNTNVRRWRQVQRQQANQGEAD